MTTQTTKCQTCATLWHALTIARLAEDGPFGGYGPVTNLDAHERTVLARQELRAHRSVCERTAHLHRIAGAR